MSFLDFFRKKEKRAESSEPTVMVSYDSDFFAALVGAGNPITKQKALEIPAVQFCIELISGLVSELPVKLYEEEEDGKVTEIKDDIRVRMLNGDTGDTLNGTMLRRLWVRDYFLGGGAYAYIERDIYGMPAKLLYIDESRINAIGNCKAIYKDYSFSVDGGTYPKSDFIKILRNSKGYGKGTGIISESGTILATAYNTMVYENSVVKKGGNKKGVFTSQNQQTEGAMRTVKEGWKRMNTASSNVEDNVVVLNAGMDFKDVSQSAMDMQLNQNKQTNSAEVCGLFGVPSSMMSGTVSAEAKENFITDTLTPLLNIFETAADSDLLLETEKGRRYFAFDTRELTRGNILQRYQAYAIGKKNGFLLIDDIREQEDLPAINFPYIQLGLADVFYNPKTEEFYTPNTDAIVNLKDSGRKFVGDGTSPKEISDNFEELRYNPYHDPTNGRFTTSSGGGMGAVLHVPMGAKGKGEYVFVKEYSGTDNADFAERNSKFIKINDRQRKHYDRLLKNGDITTEEYNELISELPDNIRENGSYIMKDKDNNMIKATGTLFDYDGRTYGYNHIGNNDFVTDIETSKFLPLKQYNPSFGDSRDELTDVTYTAETVKFIAKRNRRAVPNNSEYEGELRFNPNHDPTNGQFTSGQFTTGNFSSSAIRFSGGGASKGLTNNAKDVKLDSKGNPYKYPELKLSKKEYGKVIREIDDLYDTKYKGLEKSRHMSGNYIYRFEIHDFNEYNIFFKEKI